MNGGDNFVPETVVWWSTAGPRKVCTVHHVEKTRGCAGSFMWEKTAFCRNLHPIIKSRELNLGGLNQTDWKVLTLTYTWRQTPHGTFDHPIGYQSVASLAYQWYWRRLIVIDRSVLFDWGICASKIPDCSNRDQVGQRGAEKNNLFAHCGEHDANHCWAPVAQGVAARVWSFQHRSRQPEINEKNSDGRTISSGKIILLKTD